MRKLVTEQGAILVKQGKAMMGVLFTAWLVVGPFFGIGYAQQTEDDIPAELDAAFADMDNHRQEYERNIAILQSLKEKYKDDKVAYERILEGFGIVYIDQKDYASAEPYLREAFGISPKSAKLNMLLGDVESNKQNYDKAIAHYQTALDNAKKNEMIGRIHYLIGSAYFDKEDYSTALGHLSKAIELDAKAPDYNLRGRCFARLKDFSSALMDYGKAIALKPDYAKAYHNRGVAYNRLKDYDAAVSDLETALSLDSKLAGAYFELGNAYARLEEHEAAIEAYTNYLASNPKDAKAYYNRGLSCYKIGEYQTAVENFSQAILLDVKYGRAYKMRGLTYRKMGSEEQARQDLQKARSLGVV